MGVVVQPVQTINVRLNNLTPQQVSSTTQFVGASNLNLGPAVNAAFQEANTAYVVANTANNGATISYNLANNAYNLANTILISIDGGGF